MVRIIGTALVMTALTLIGCGGAGSSSPPPPEPSITSISPTSVIAGSPGFTLRVIGTNFRQGSAVTWEGAALPTTFVSSTQLNAAIPSANIRTPNKILIGVADVADFSSTFVQFTINYPVPQVSALIPAHLQAGAAPFRLTVAGSGFYDGSTIQWNRVARPVLAATSSQLQVAMSAADVANAGIAQVIVSNPGPGGGQSLAATFTIDPLTHNPTPQISSMSDSSAPAGWPGFPLSIKGSGFVAATTAQWNGTNRPTNVLSSTSLVTAIPVTDLSSPADAQITLFNGPPDGGSSTVFPFSVELVAPGAVGVIERSSLSTSLAEANNASFGSGISGDGRYVAFVSSATDLVPGGANGFSQVYLRDTCIGGPAGCVPSVILVSVSSAGQQGNGGSYSAAISASGRFVAFSSDASNLVSGDTNRFTDVFVRDTCIGAPAGCAPSTERVSLDPAGSQILMQSLTPGISGDGRFVAFVSGMNDYYYGLSNISVLVHDTCANAPSGCSAKTTRVDVSTTGQASNASSFAEISSSGRYVAFVSSDGTLVSPNIPSNVAHVFLRDTCTGAPASCKPSTILVVRNLQGGASSMGENLEFLSGDGRYVVFSSKDHDLVVGDTNGFSDVFVKDTCNGASTGCTPTTTRVSIASDSSQGNDHSYGGAISANGRFVVFSSDATDLVSGDTNKSTDVFLRDTCLGVPAVCTPSTIRLSVALDGTQGDKNSLLSGMTPDGRFVLVTSDATKLGPGDTNGFTDVFLVRTNVP